MRWDNPHRSPVQSPTSMCKRSIDCGALKKKELHGFTALATDSWVTICSGWMSQPQCRVTRFLVRSSGCHTGTSSSISSTQNCFPHDQHPENGHRHEFANMLMTIVESWWYSFSVGNFQWLFSANTQLEIVGGKEYDKGQ